MKTLTLLLALLITSTAYTQNDPLALTQLTFNTLRHNNSVELPKMQQIHFANGSFYAAQTTAAAGDTVYTFYLPELSISQYEKGSQVIYGFEKNVTKFRLSDSTLTADPDMYKYKVQLKDIRSITFHHGSNAGTFSLSAGVIGFLLGFAASSFGHNDVDVKDRLFGGLAGGAVFSIIGGALGLLFTNDEYYNLYTLSVKDKHAALLKILKKNKLTKK
ncbi:MAG: hypothetical protein IAE90_05255 [Ignavibacteria bacterium]|nr:hypothetical protein [Ignavibacteria bacterium]